MKWISHIYIHISLPSWTPLPPCPPTHPSSSSSCFTHGSAHMSIPISQFTPPCPSCVYMSLLYVCVSFLALYSGILPGHKKEQNWVVCRDMDQPRVCHTGWSESEREKQISHINACVWNIEKMAQISLPFEVGDFCLSVPMQKEAWDHYTRQRSGNRDLEGTWEPFKMTIVIKKDYISYGIYIFLNMWLIQFSMT